jgi:polar amino acid transport system permease protein
MVAGGAPARDTAMTADLLRQLSGQPIVPLRRYGRWSATTVVILLLAGFAWLVIVNPNFRWTVVGQYLFAPEVLDGVLITIELTVLAMLVGSSIGVVMALMRLSDNPLLNVTAQVYVACFRGTPALVQLIFWYNMSALFPHIAVSIPFGPQLFSIDANALITPMIAAVLGLGLCEGAYMAEIVRSGIQSVDSGQREAATAVGMTRAQAMRKVILPQALRVIIPPTGNQVIGMMKYTSLASVISVTELLTSVQLIYNRTYEVIPLLIVASIWYLVLTTVLTVCQRAIERKVGRSRNRLAVGRDTKPFFSRGSMQTTSTVQPMTTQSVLTQPATQQPAMEEGPS